MMWFTTMRRRVRISRGGQISIPAAIRHRWGTSTLVLQDEGDRILLEPAPDDPIAAAEGALAQFGPIDVRQLRRAAREAERAAESVARTSDRSRRMLDRRLPGRRPAVKHITMLRAVAEAESIESVRLPQQG